MKKLKVSTKVTRPDTWAGAVTQKSLVIQKYYGWTNRLNDRLTQ